MLYYSIGERSVLLSDSFDVYYIVIRGSSHCVKQVLEVWYFINMR